MTTPLDFVAPTGPPVYLPIMLWPIVAMLLKVISIVELLVIANVLTAGWTRTRTTFSSASSESQQIR